MPFTINSFQLSSDIFTFFTTAIDNYRLLIPHHIALLQSRSALKVSNQSDSHKCVYCFSRKISSSELLGKVLPLSGFGSVTVCSRTIYCTPSFILTDFFPCFYFFLFLFSVPFLFYFFNTKRFKNPILQSLSLVVLLSCTLD